MLSCEEATRLMSDAQERALPLGERMSLRMHLAMCRGCRNFGRQVGSLRQLSQAYVQRRDDEPPPGL